jgi:cell division protein FtsL
MPPAAATAAARRSAHVAGPRRVSGAAAPRRVSGPAQGRKAVPRMAGPSRAGAMAAPRPLALRVAGAVHTVAEHRLLDRVIRGRMWIAILGLGLIGIVFMQVSMLRMNAGIGRAVEQATTLERQNAALQASISQLSSGDRVQQLAASQGMVQPAGTPRFLDARSLDLRQAVRGITAPSQTPPTTLSPSSTGAAATATAATSVPPPAAQTAAAAPTGTAATAPPAQTGGAMGAATTAQATPPATAPTATTAPAGTTTAGTTTAGGAVAAPGGQR